MIHAFGDSYVALTYPHNKDLTYLDILSNYYNTKVINYAKGGSGLEFTFGEVYRNINKINSDDIVLIVLTDQNRQYFFKNPTLGNFIYIDYFKDQGITAEMKQAWEYYIKYLSYNDFELQEQRTVFFLHYINEHARRLNLKFLIVRGFNNAFDDKIHQDNFSNLIISNGSLNDITKNELIIPNNEWIYFRYHNGMDPRENHMSEINHTILADKIIQTVVNGAPLDLMHGFKKHFIEC